MNDRFNILITGAAGFIGSSIVTQLNSRGFYNLLLVDILISRKKTVIYQERSSGKR